MLEPQSDQEFMRQEGAIIFLHDLIQDWKQQGVRQPIICSTLAIALGRAAAPLSGNDILHLKEIFDNACCLEKRED